MNLQKARMMMGVQVLVSDPKELEKVCMLVVICLCACVFVFVCLCGCVASGASVQSLICSLTLTAPGCRVEKPLEARGLCPFTLIAWTLPFYFDHVFYFCVHYDHPDSHRHT